MHRLSVVCCKRRTTNSFLPRDAMHKRCLCRHAVCVCGCVCVSVTFVSCVKTNKDNYLRNFFTIGSQAILVFPCQTRWRYSDGNPPPLTRAPNAAECMCGIVRNRDSGLISGYRRLLDVRSAKNIYRRRS